MKKKWLTAVNILIMLSILLFVFIYSDIEKQNAYTAQVQNFENTTVNMERITDNYLYGEQGICDVWANYIGSEDMTLEEAAEFIRNSHVLKNTSAHIIYADTLQGLSTRGSILSPGVYEVSYRSIDIFGDMSWISGLGEAVNITRAYTNPLNGEQSLGFVNRIELSDGEGGKKDALLLRIVPVSEVEEKWVFPQELLDNAELCIIDEDGNYIIKDASFKNNNFYEFYRSYNDAGKDGVNVLKQSVISYSGSFSMTDSRGRDCIVAHTPVASSEGWALLSLIPASDLQTETEDWLLIAVVSAGLLLLFILNLSHLRGLNRQLERMAKEAESANKAKTDFLSTMSHDIRTPMNAIIGLTSIAERNFDDRDSVRESLRKISLASNHLLTLINDILDISKVESGKLNLSPLSFSIVETVENLVNISQPMIKEKNIDFNFRIDRMEKEYLYADQLRLNQIYINILSNAIKYTQPGGSVNVDLREEESPQDGCVRLVYKVKDTGIGMSPEFMEEMYQPFSRQTDSRVNSVQGTGLGLAITRQMVDLMHGTIDCQSELGKGTEFTITLDIPVADRQPADMQLEPIDVLIADDDPVLLETAADTLNSLGVRAYKAGSGDEALAMIKERRSAGQKYDVVILDWKMSGMDGVETVKRIRSEIDKDIPVLLISAYDWSDIEDAAREAGVNGFISKPLFRSILYDKINEILGKDASPSEPEDDYSDLAGMNILVAEDNDINWEVIHAILGMFGIDSERAENGKECVDKLQQAQPGSYGLIFMDIQMPVMNGLDATRAIRKLEDPVLAGIPVIAMTADAFSENVAECLAAGMNGHIAKPVDIKLVIKEIRRIKEERK
ncbi:MAG: response regulator [Firmicutes bacterium]|nr:response regulator [Bacillota bacterium]